MNRLTVFLVSLTVVLLTGCRTAHYSYYPMYDPAIVQSDEQTAQQEYIRNTLQWQQDQQNRDRLINNNRIKKRRFLWWLW
jgi:hypothetical protein